MLLKGQPLLEDAIRRAHAFPSPQGIPHLAIILVGRDPASVLYVKRKKEAAQEAGFASTLHCFEDTVTEEEVVEHIQSLNQDPSITGILVQLPLPSSFRRQRVLDAVAPLKDVDGLTTTNAGHLYTGHPQLVPCTPLACMHLIKQWKRDLTGLQALVLGQSTLVGKPLDFLLLKEKCTVIMAHKDTSNVPDLSRLSDIVIAAVGHKHLVRREWIKQGCCIIDVGINPQNGNVYGDVDFDSVKDLAGAITPVPGGVGPATIASLLDNLMQAHQLQHL